MLALLSVHSARVGAGTTRIFYILCVHGGRGETQCKVNTAKGRESNKATGVCVNNNHDSHQIFFSVSDKC